MKKLVLGIFIGVLLCGGVVYGATLIDSSDVTYTSNNNSFNANNVKTALDEIYAKVFSGGNVYYLGTSSSYDIKTLFPDLDYTALTNDNFLVMSESGSTSMSRSDLSCYFGGWNTVYTKPTASYNASTGVLSVNLGATSSTVTNCSSISTRLTTKTYLIVGGITNKTN